MSGKRLTSILLSIGILAYVVQTSLGTLGITKIQGKETRFDWRRVDRKTIRLVSDAGDMVCQVRLKLRWADSKVGLKDLVSARISSEEALSVRKRSETAFWIDLEKDDPKRRAAKFTWPSGQSIEVCSTNGELLAVDDWEVYLEKDESDSMVRSNRRCYIKVFSWLVGIPSLLYLLYKNLTDNKKLEHKLDKITPENCIRSLINQVTFPDIKDSKESTKRMREDTERMQNFLERWLLHHDDVATAQAAMGLNLEEKHRTYIAIQAIGKLRKLTRSFRDGLHDIFPISDIC